MATLRGLAALFAVVGISAGISADPPEYRVRVKEGDTLATELLLPIDPTVRISPQHTNNIYFGLTVDGKRITCSPMGSIWPATWIDGAMQIPANGGQPLANQPLPKGQNGKARIGFSGTWKTGDVEFTQTVEVVPSKPLDAKPGAKRRLDTCRISYLIHNKGKVNHEVGLRANIDILINNNDGAHFLSPSTHPGKVLNGIALEGKAMPAYLMVIERSDPKDYGFYGVMTLKMGSKFESPNNVVMTILGAVGGGWDVQAIPAGDSAAAVFWEKKTIKPGEKRELAWAYGGGIANNPENEGRVTVSLAGNMEPGKLFTVAALVEDPIPSQTLGIEFPEGVERIDGAEVQPVPDPNPNGYSMVVWKGRVTRTGDFDLRIRSSSGVMHTKSISVQEIASQDAK